MSLLCSSVFLVTQVLQYPVNVRWTGLLFLALAGWCGVRSHHLAARAKACRSIGSRLARLPRDFVVVNDLTIRAPWGSTHVDHIIVSRYGAVVVSDGDPHDWMGEKVEAVRSLLFARGLLRPPFPVRSLVLLPPGLDESRVIQLDAPVVRVDRISLEHLAPGTQPVLTPAQIAAVWQCLLTTRVAA